MMMILKVPADTFIVDLSEEVQGAIANVKGQFPESQLIGTSAINGEKLVMINVEATRVEVEALIGVYDLEWLILAVEDETIDQSLLLPFFNDIPVTVDDETIYEPIGDLNGKLQTWAGKNWNY